MEVECVSAFGSAGVALESDRDLIRFRNADARNRQIVAVSQRGETSGNGPGCRSAPTWSLGSER